MTSEISPKPNWISDKAEPPRNAACFATETEERVRGTGRTDVPGEAGEQRN